MCFVSVECLQSHHSYPCHSMQLPRPEHLELPRVESHGDAQKAGGRALRGGAVAGGLVGGGLAGGGDGGGRGGGRGDGEAGDVGEGLHDPQEAGHCSLMYSGFWAHSS